MADKEDIPDNISDTDYGDVVEDDQEPEQASQVDPLPEPAPAVDPAEEEPAIIADQVDQCEPKEVQPEPESEAVDELQDLDAAISATVVTEVDDDTGPGSDMSNQQGDFEESTPAVAEPVEARKESIDDLKGWIRQTSTKLKSFKRTASTEPKKASSGDRPVVITPSKPIAPVQHVPKTILIGPTQTPYIAPSAATFQAVQANTIPYQELVQRNLVKEYEGLTQTLLETYLSDADFLQVFGKDRVEYYKQPRWRQVDQKKKAQLF